MDTFELDSDAFYICTEISPQNFVVQKAIQIDKSQLERMVGKFDGKSAVEKAASPDSSLGTPSAHSPGGTSPSTSAASGSGNSHVPPIPYWFNRECKTRLMMLGPQPLGPPNISMYPSSSTHCGPAPPASAPPATHEDLKQQLKNQLEYYFSRENLISDKYLKCQMDSEQFVPISVVANFKKILALTHDVDLIVEALKDSVMVELDENCEKVRPITKRTTIIIREIPEDRRDLVEELLLGGPIHTELKYGLNESWYVTFDNELDTQLGYVCVQHKNNDLTGRRVCARIKAGGPPTAGSTTDTQNGDKGKPTATVSNGENNGQIQLRELGQTLSDYGFVPVASFRPGESILRHFQYQSKTCQFAGNSLGYTQPPLQTSLADPQLQPANFFYQSNMPTTPRNFDEYSSASSNSTHTNASNYNNRSGSSNGGVGGANYNNQCFESRSSFSNSNEWRGRGSSGGRFQNNHNHSETNGRQNSSRGNWRGGRNGTVTNGYSNQSQSHRPNGQHTNWRNEQNGHHNNWRNDQNVPQNNWRSEQNGHAQSSSNYRNQQNGHQNNWKNENTSHSSNQSWHTNNGESQSRRPYNNSHNNRQNPPVSSSSSSSISSKYFSPNAVETPTNSGPSTPPPSAPGKSQQQYTPPTPSDMPPPPVWPAPNFDRRRKSSEASSTTITTNTATITLSTPVISAEDFPAFADAQETVVVEKLKPKDAKQPKEKSAEATTEKPKTKIETAKAVVVEKEKVRSPPVAPVPAPTPSFAFEETAFPSLPKKVEPVKPPQKPTFSSVAAGRRNLVKQMAPEKKTSYAEKLKQRQALLRK